MFSFNLSGSLQCVINPWGNFDYCFRITPDRPNSVHTLYLYKPRLRVIAVYTNSPILPFLITCALFLQKRHFCPYFTCTENNCSSLFWCKVKASVWITYKMDAINYSLLCSRRRLYYVGLRLQQQYTQYVCTIDKGFNVCRISIHFILFYELSSLFF